MKRFNIYKASKKNFAKMIIISICPLINFVHASEITQVTQENLQPQINTIELTSMDKIQVYQFPDQEEYLLICTNNRPKKGERYYKIYKGSLDFLTQLYVKSHFEGSEDLSINTTVGSYTNGKYFDKNAPDFPAWYDETEKQYISLIPCYQIDDVINIIVWKDIDEVL